jgi:hypothetical protein
VWDVPGRPVWIDAPEPSLDEVRSILTIVRSAEERGPALGVSKVQQTMIGVFRSSLEQLVKKGFVSKGERLGVRFGALRLFQEAQRLSATPAPADGDPATPGEPGMSGG